MDDLELIARFAPHAGPDGEHRRRAASLLAKAIEGTGGPTRRPNRSPRRRSIAYAAAGGVAAAVTIAVVLITAFSPGGGGGVQSAYAAVDRAGAATASAARHSGNVAVRITHSGRFWAGEQVGWNQGNASVSCAGMGSCGRLLLVDGVFFTRTGGAWIRVDKGGLPAYMHQRYVDPALQSMSRDTFRRITEGMQHLKIHHGPNGTTIYNGREAAGVITRDPGTGEQIRVLPFGFVAKGAAADPSAMLRMSLTVASNGLIQQIVAAWGSGASAWNFTVDYSHLGTAPPIAAPR